jgi:hypothetical protein
VTFRDVLDIQHSVLVHAETTMDAAARPAQGLAQDDGADG